MPLASGDRIGPYEIVSPLGAGGMGEVYRAKDARLKREVALKVLPAGVASDRDRLARFQREAEVLASLNHPHIAHIHGLEESSGTIALVMELVEGSDLSERIARGAIPIDEALPIARQIADALEAAHEQGIIHRDLKPANVKVRPDGTVKVLDFGLAKAFEPGSGVRDPKAGNALDNSPTVTSPGMTMRGIILGTAAYMSPEQAKGQVVDRRADIWAFGCVLFEMLTGRRVFDGADVSDVLVAVLSKEVPMAALPPATPVAIRQLLLRCLAREPRRRLRDIGEARLVIDDVLSGAAQPAGEAATGTAAAHPTPLAWIAALMVTAAVAAAAGYFINARSATAAIVEHLSIELRLGQEFSLSTNAVMAFSPDGGSLVFPGRENGRGALFRRSLADGTITRIEGTDDGSALFFSPDGKWIGFAAGNQLLKVPAEGGRPYRIGEAQGSGGGTWLNDGTIVFAPLYSDGLFRIDADGGTPERLTTPDRGSGELGHFWASALPGDRYVLFTGFRSPIDLARVGVLDLTTKQVRWIVEGATFGRYLPTGHLIYARQQRLFSVPFDARSATITGTATPVVDDLHVSPTGGWTPLAVSSRGTLAYLTSTVARAPAELVWVERNGRASPASTDRRSYFSVSLSPDATQAGVTIAGDSLDLWNYSFSRRTLSRLTTSPATEFQAEWSADGRTIYYVRDRPPFELYRMDAATPDSGRPMFRERAEVDSVGLTASPDGKTVAYSSRLPDNGSDVFARLVDGSAPPVTIVATRAEEKYPTFSPDGRLIAYESDQTGQPEIYVQPYPGSGERVQVSSDGGRQPIWARNGEIFYWHDDELRAIATRTRTGFEFDPAKSLFTFVIVVPEELVHAYAVAADGSRILAISTPEALRPRRIDVVTNWTSTLPR